MNNEITCNKIIFSLVICLALTLSALLFVKPKERIVVKNSYDVAKDSTLIKKHKNGKK